MRHAPLPLSRRALLLAAAALVAGCGTHHPAPSQAALAQPIRLATSGGFAEAQAGLARSTLSKIENGQMSPTYEALKKLAQGMDMSVPQLFTPPSRAQVSGRISVTKSGEGQGHATSTYEHELLAGALTKKQMLPYRAVIRARDMEEFDGWVRHDGEEFLYVLTGVVRLYTEFYEPVELRRGDSAYYDASMGHNVVSVSDDDATLLWVTSLA